MRITACHDGHLTLIAAQPCNPRRLISAASPHILSPLNEHRGACSDAPLLPTALPLHTNSWPLTSLPWSVTMETDNPRSSPRQKKKKKRCVYFNPPSLGSACPFLVLTESCRLLLLLLLLLWWRVDRYTRLQCGASVRLSFTSVCGFFLIPTDIKSNVCCY